MKRTGNCSFFRVPGMAYISVMKVQRGGVLVNSQPLAENKGVHRKVESEGSSRRNSGLRNTNHIRL